MTPQNSPRDSRRLNSRHHPRPTKPPTHLESLELRQLLSVDLSGFFTALPAIAPNDSRQHFTISLENSGDTAIRGGVPFDVYALPQGFAFDPAADIFLGHFLKPGTLAAGFTAPFTFTAPLSAAIAGGQYQLVAVIDPNNRIAETNESNNLVQSPPFTITQPDFDLVPTFGTGIKLPSQLNAGSNQSIQLTITNPATSTATLPVGAVIQVEIFARPVGGGPSADVLLNQTIANVNVARLAPGQSRTINVPLHIPSSLPGGTFSLVANIDTTGVIAETNENNNEVLLPNVVIVNSSPFVPANPGNTGGRGGTAGPGTIANLNPPPVNLAPPNLGTTPTGVGQLGTGTIIATPIMIPTAPLSATGSTPTNSIGNPPAFSLGAGTANSIGTTPTGSLGFTVTGGLGNPLTGSLGMTPVGFNGI